MTQAGAILVTLLIYNAALIAIGIWAARRTSDDNDFFLGGRRLGAWVAGLSACASSSSAWTLLGVSGAAYAWGLSALWIFPATLSGFIINWYWVAPRLMTQSRDRDTLTLTEFLAGDRRDRHYAAIMRLSAIAIIFSFIFYVAAQFQAAGDAFAASFGLSTNGAIALGAIIIVAYTLLGGFWAVSVTDTLQGLLMVASAMFLPIVMLMHIGGFDALISGLAAENASGEVTFTRGLPGFLGLAFVLGTLGIGIGYPGQPHVATRFMALRDRDALRRGRIIAIAWGVLIYAGMLLLGLCGRVIFETIPNNEQIFFESANRLLPPIAAGLAMAAVLSAIMSTADSQLLVAASSISWDWQRAAGRPTKGIRSSRVVVVILSVFATLLAMYAPSAIFSRVLFAWSALGSAFGPALLVKLAGYRISSGTVYASIAAGFGSTIIAYLLPDGPGDWIERLVPFAIALAICLVRNPEAAAEPAET